VNNMAFTSGGESKKANAPGVCSWHSLDHRLWCDSLAWALVTIVTVNRDARGFFARKTKGVGPVRPLAFLAAILTCVLIAGMFGSYAVFPWIWVHPSFHAIMCILVNTSEAIWWQEWWQQVSMILPISLGVYLATCCAAVPLVHLMVRRSDRPCVSTSDTLSVICYSLGSTFPWCLVPLIGSVASVLLGIRAMTIGFSTVHRTHRVTAQFLFAAMSSMIILLPLAVLYYIFWRMELGWVPDLL